MFQSTNIWFNLWVVTLFISIMLVSSLSYSQISPVKTDSLALKFYSTLPWQDSSNQQFKDTLIKSMQALIAYEKNNLLKNPINQKKDSNLLNKKSFTGKTDSVAKNLFRSPIPQLSARNSIIAFGGGFLNYNYAYRSNIDTPFNENNISQHQLLSTMNFQVAGFIPIQVNAFFRRSNSSLFQNINDVQVIFNAAAFRNQLSSRLTTVLTSQVKGLRDSILENAYQAKKLESGMFGNWLNGYFTHQKLLEAYEILNVPKKSYDMRLPDSTNKKRADSAQGLARSFIAFYEKTKKTYDAFSKELDSLKTQYERSIKKIKEMEGLLKGQLNSYTSYGKLKDELQKYAPGVADIPAKYQWLLGIRNFALGRSTLTNSELTAKNISLTGINFEYNSWYYLAFTAGNVDYRFRDFIVNQVKTPQWLVMLRLGVGRLEGNYFILSAFKGQKQIYSSGNLTGGLTTIPVTGFTAETKWQIARNSYLIAEAGQSLAPDPSKTPAISKSAWDWSDKTSKALSLKFYWFIPKTSSRIEGAYKFTGANYQSFNAFQTNAQSLSWWVKAEQNLFGRKLRLAASLRENDYSNPYIIQNYKASTVFATMTATLRLKKLPQLSIGYMPMSQLTMVGNQLTESRFQTLNISLNHFYKIGQEHAATSIVYTKFYNNQRDSGFIYYNATNVLASESIMFRRFSNTINISVSKNISYQYNVMEESISVPLSKVTTINGGVKINFLNDQQSKVGGYGGTSFRSKRGDVFSLRFESSYLPAYGNKLVNTTLGNASFIKMFR